MTSKGKPVAMTTDEDDYDDLQADVAASDDGEMDEDGGVPEDRELSVLETIGFLQPQRQIVPIVDADGVEDADAAKKLDDAAISMASLIAENGKMAKMLIMNPASMATEATNGAEEDNGDGEEGGGGEGTAAPKKRSNAPLLDTRVFDEMPILWGWSYLNSNCVPESTRVKYLRPNLPEVKGASPAQYQSPERAPKYKSIKPSELPFHKPALETVKSGAAITHALQRVGEEVVLGTWPLLGGIVTYPGTCSVDFDALPVISEASSELAKLTSPFPTYDREQAAAAAVIAAPVSDDNQYRWEFVHIEPVRITLAAYIKSLQTTAATVAKQAAKPGQKSLNQLMTNRRTKDIARMLALANKRANELPNGGAAAADNIILRMYVYRSFGTDAVKASKDTLFRSVWHPVGKDEEAARDNRRQNLRFIKQTENKTWVEITSTTTVNGEDEVHRKIVQVPIIPPSVWKEISEEFKADLEDVKPASGAVADEEEQQPAAAAAVEEQPAATPKKRKAPASQGEAEAAAPPPKTTEKKAVIAAPTKEEVVSKTTVAKTQEKVKQQIKESAAADFLNANASKATVIAEAAKEDTPATAATAQPAAKKAKTATPKKTAEPPTVEAPTAAAKKIAETALPDRSPEQAKLLEKLVAVQALAAKEPRKPETYLGKFWSDPQNHACLGDKCTPEQRPHLTNAVWLMHFLGLETEFTDLMKTEVKRNQAAAEAKKAAAEAAAAAAAAEEAKLAAVAQDEEDVFGDI